MKNPEKDQSAPPATTNLHDSPPRPAQREIGGSSSRGHQSRPVPPPPETRHGERTPTTFIGTTFKARWQPKQTRIMVAEQLNKYQIPPLGDTINFLDPAGKVHHIAIKLHDGRQWFEDGLLQMMEYYDLHSTVEINYTYRLQNYFHVRIWRTNGLGEIRYKEVQEVDHEVKEETEEIVVIHDDEDDNQVLPVTIMTNELHPKQKNIQVKLPSGEIQTWTLLWNTRIEKHCRFRQGYYQYCRQATLNHGDELTFWKIIGAPHYGLQVKRQRE
ncbi:DNA-binding barrel domain superfamily [Sesbania bispinosa]|nr:DNA-binding barrel domain superfamily [Sesbania bispinosa]